MTLWVILFLLIVAISFILAIRSMKDYQEVPQKLKQEYGLFLIRRTNNFNAQVLDAILKLITAEGLIVSIERLFKGNETTLTVFGPKTQLNKFSAELGLLELEDYAADLETKDISVWELGVKVPFKFNPDSLDNVFDNLPALDPNDRFFWQVVLGRGQTQIRAATSSKNAPIFHNLRLGELIKIPQPFSAEQMLSFYKLRSLSKDSQAPVLTAKGVARLLKISL